MPTLDAIVDITKHAGIGEFFIGPEVGLREPLTLDGQTYTALTTRTRMAADDYMGAVLGVQFAPQLDIRLHPNDVAEREEPEEGLVTTLKYAPFELSPAAFEHDDMPLPQLVPEKFGVWYGSLSSEEGRQAIMNGMLGRRSEEQSAAGLAAETLLAMHGTFQALGYEAIGAMYARHQSPQISS